MPKDEASCEQWVWQAKEALKSCTAGAVRITIVQSVWGEVREFTAAVSFEESIETLLEKVEDRIGEKWTTDGLQQDFYKITQGKNEKVRQFTGRLKAQFKKLKEKVPGHYDSSILKEHPRSQDNLIKAQICSCQWRINWDPGSETKDRCSNNGGEVIHTGQSLTKTEQQWSHPSEVQG